MSDSDHQQQQLEAAVRAGVRFTPTATPQVIHSPYGDRRGKHRSPPNPTLKIGATICLAAFAYPWVVYPVTALYSTVVGILMGGSATEFVEIWGFGLVACLPASMFVTMLTLVALIPGFMAVELCRMGLAWRPRTDRYGAHVGGATALIIIFPPACFMVEELIEWQLIGAPLFIAASWFVALMAAILVGQIGGAHGGVALLLEERRAGIRPADDDGRFRFRIGQTLGLTAIVGVVLAGLRGVGALRPSVLIVLGAWLLVHWLAAPWAVRYARWRKRRRMLRRPTVEQRRAEREASEQALARFRERNAQLLEQERRRRAGEPPVERST